MKIQAFRTSSSPFFNAWCYLEEDNSMSVLGHTVFNIILQNNKTCQKGSSIICLIYSSVSALKCHDEFELHKKMFGCELFKDQQ